MLRSCSRLIALLAVFAGLTIAQAADTILTLACQGTVACDSLQELTPKGVARVFYAKVTDPTVARWFLSRSHRLVRRGHW